MENMKTWQPLKIFSMYNHKNLTSIERLNYLLLALNGQALQVVQGLPFTAKNYSIALNFLVDRYENKKLTAATNVRQMLALKSISKDDVEEIMQFVKTFYGS
jgi:hypothetical protein